MLITLETYYILHHSAGNGQLAFHSLVLIPDTDSSTFTKGCAHYGQLILVYKSNRKAMNRNWSNQKANPALKTKTGNK